MTKVGIVMQKSSLYFKNKVQNNIDRFENLAELKIQIDDFFKRRTDLIKGLSSRAVIDNFYSILDNYLLEKGLKDFDIDNIINLVSQIGLNVNKLIDNINNEETNIFNDVNDDYVSHIMSFFNDKELYYFYTYDIISDSFKEKLNHANLFFNDGVPLTATYLYKKYYNDLMNDVYGRNTDQ
jgi:hypothetical protein